MGRSSKDDLNKAFTLLLKSMDYYIPKYTLIVYTNYNIPIKHKNVIFRKYYDNTKNKLYDTNSVFNNWLNLCFNRINIYKDLYDEFKIDYTWIDLDTVLFNDLSYLHNLDNLFLEIGGPSERKEAIFSNNKSIVIPRNRTIQGNLWKLNINMYNDLMKCLKNIQDKNLKLNLDVQHLFNYYIHLYNRDSNIKKLIYLDIIIYQIL